MLGEERFVGGVNGSEIVEIFDEYGGLDDIADGEASGFNDRFHVVQRLGACADTSSGTLPVFGSTGIWPEVMIMLPRSTP